MANARTDIVPCCLLRPTSHCCQGGKLESDLRYLSLSAFLWQPQQQQAQPLCLRQPQQQARAPLVFAVAAASDASLALLCADLRACPRVLGAGRRPLQWRAAAALQHHTSPVLCTAHCLLEPGPCSSSGSQARHIVCSGATDGAVALWDVTAAAAAAAAASTSGGGAEGGDAAAPAVAPLLVLGGIHESGVNAMAAAPAGEEGGMEQVQLWLLQGALLVGSSAQAAA